MKKIIIFLFINTMGAIVYGQGEILFDDNQLHEIYFEMVDTSIFINGKEYQMVNTIIDGNLIDSIGFKKKGNISAFHNNNKFPFKIKTNKYVKGKKYDGIKEFTLHNSYQDPSMLREKMTYDLCNELGLHSLQAAFAKVYINGDYWGLYTLLEAKDELYKRAFDNKDGAVLESTDFGDMCYKGLTMEDYYDNVFEDYIYDIENGDELLAWEKFPTMLDMANNTPSADFMNVVPDYLNIEDFIRYQALNVYLLNFDSYLAFQGNQLYYFDEMTEIWEVIPWDFNASFGLWNTNNFRPFDYELIPSRINNGCIASKINEVPELENFYMETMCELVHTFANPTRLINLVDQWRAQIEQAVYEDWRKEFDNSLFDQATEFGYFPFGWSEDVPAMKTFVNDRWTFIKNQMDAMNIDCSTITATNEIVSNREFLISPNPVTNWLEISVPKNEDYKIYKVEIYNLQGQNLQAFNGNDQTALRLDLAELNSGFYVIKLCFLDKEFVTRKLLKF